MVSYAKHKTKFTQLIPESIWLEAEDFEEAVKISKRVTDEAHQWQMYLNSLALISFGRWVKQRYPDLSVNLDNCSLVQSANITDVVSNIKLGKFKVCLLVMEELLDTEVLLDKVSVPKVAVDLPELAAHFYVVVSVLEEEERVILCGFLRYDELVDYRSRVNLEVTGDDCYQLPLSLFDGEMNHLLFASRYLEASAILLPVIQEDDGTIILPVIQEEEVKRDIAEKLLGDIVTQPEKIDLLQEILTNVTQNTVNTWLWLQEQIDELSSSLSWVMLPAFTPTGSFTRSHDILKGESPAEEFQAIISHLESNGKIEISLPARAAYREINLAEIPLRFYAFVWSLWPQISTGKTDLKELEGGEREWALLCILRAQPGAKLPVGIALQVSDESNILDDSVLEEEEEGAYLYSYAIASWEESLFAKISLQNGQTLTLPPFTFVSEQLS